MVTTILLSRVYRRCSWLQEIKVKPANETVLIDFEKKKSFCDYTWTFMLLRLKESTPFLVFSQILKTQRKLQKEPWIRCQEKTAVFFTYLLSAPVVSLTASIRFPFCWRKNNFHGCGFLFHPPSLLGTLF